MYFRHSPDTQMEFLKTFDAPNPVECYMRSQSVVPQQALALANSQITQEEAACCARVGVESTPAAFVKTRLRNNTWDVCRQRKNKPSANDFCNGNRICSLR